VYKIKFYIYCVYAKIVKKIDLNKTTLPKTNAKKEYKHSTIKLLNK